MAVTQLCEALAFSVRARACRWLLEISTNSADASVTQNELARLIGVTRGTARRCLNELTAMGAIEWRYRQLRVINREILEQHKDEQ